MDREVLDLALPPEVRDRLARSTALEGAPLTGPLTAPAARAVLARTEILVTGWGCPPLTAEVLAHAPRLRAVMHAAGTVKHLVTEAVWDRGIAVSSAADANAGPVAAFTLAAITFAAKGALTAASRYGEPWSTQVRRPGLDGRTIGVIGASRIGRRVLEGLRAADTRHELLLTDPYVATAEAAKLGAERVDLDELCARSTIVTVHAPELPGTRGMVGHAQLARIPDGGTLINTARGSLVDTEALTRECASGRLSAYLDVTHPEPLPPDHPLLSLRNVLVTPHIAGAQGEEVRRLGEYAVAEVERFVAGEELWGRVGLGDLGRVA
ncbi:hydroxyacid dehydrogenase [Streptomyces sp. NPDC002851]